MVFLTSMAAIFMVYYFKGAAIPYALAVALSVEIFALMYVYNLLKKGETKLRDDYNKIIDGYKNRSDSSAQERKDLKDLLDKYKQSSAEFELKFKRLETQYDSDRKKLKECYQKIDAYEQTIHEQKGNIEKYKRIIKSKMIT